MSKKPKLLIQNHDCDQGILISLPDKSLNHGREVITNAMAMRNANTTTKNDSLKNCPTNCLRIEPIAFRIPTSFARFSDLAVLKFMKLMHANNKTNTPIDPMNQTNCKGPL